MFKYLYEQVKDNPALLLVALLFLGIVYKDVRADTFWGTFKAQDVQVIEPAACESSDLKDWI